MWQHYRPLGTHGVLRNPTCSALDSVYIAHQGGSVMKCPRCQGRMFAEKFYDFVRSFDAWRCTCCGEVVDTTILVNRARSANTFLG